MQFVANIPDASTLNVLRHRNAQRYDAWEKQMRGKETRAWGKEIRARGRSRCREEQDQPWRGRDYEATDAYDDPRIAEDTAGQL